MVFSFKFRVSPPSLCVVNKEVGSPKYRLFPRLSPPIGSLSFKNLNKFWKQSLGYLNIVWLEKSSAKVDSTAYVEVELIKPRCTESYLFPVTYIAQVPQDVRVSPIPKNVTWTISTSFPEFPSRSTVFGDFYYQNFTLMSCNLSLIHDTSTTEQWSKAL